MNQSSRNVTIFAAIQWMFFIFVNVVVVPVSIGAAFELSTGEVVSILRTSLIVTGAACILQGWIGHRYPLLEGPSGIIWGMMLTLAASAQSLGLTLTEVGGGIATGMLLAGVVTVLLAVFGAVPLVHKLFKPMVMNVFLLLLSLQLAVIFFDGMIGVANDGAMHIGITAFSVAVAIFVAFLKVKGNKLISNFSLLIGIIVGWPIYSLLFSGAGVIEAENMAGAGGLLLFPLGQPNLELGIVIMTFVACLLNMSNTFAAIQAASAIYNDKPQQSRYRNSLLLTGLYSVVGSLFGLVAYAPFASAIGFLESTQIYDKKPFLYGGAMIALLGVIPSLAILLAQLPITVGNAVLFVAYMQLFGTALKSVRDYSFNSVTVHRIAAPVLLGVSIMMADPLLFTSLPSLIQPLISNGFMMGVLLSIVMELTMKWDQPDGKTNKEVQN
ncbi:uracil/xanthine transporter [Paenibacillus septentrionalis]|uniref:Uracil/xanthine transporter n=1 Tax=Paenibacillus septentrionalis TaxID=429342 RepID=A0ABW1V9Z9_9BACL